MTVKEAEGMSCSRDTKRGMKEWRRKQRRQRGGRLCGVKIKTASNKQGSEKKTKRSEEEEVDRRLTSWFIERLISFCQSVPGWHMSNFMSINPIKLKWTELSSETWRGMKEGGRGGAILWNTKLLHSNTPHWAPGAAMSFLCVQGDRLYQRSEALHRICTLRQTYEPQWKWVMVNERWMLTMNNTSLHFQSVEGSRRVPPATAWSPQGAPRGLCSRTC